MNKIWLYKIAIIVGFIFSACGPTTSTVTSSPPATVTQEPTPTNAPTSIPGAANATNPCIGAAAPTQWNHVVVLMFENKQYNEVIGPAPYITSLANKCTTVANWMDANTKVDGSPDGKYNSKPNYATLTNGLSPSAHGLIDDNYNTTTSMNNIYSQLNLAGKSFKDYYEAKTSDGCNTRFSGDYHDPIRYYTNVASVCNNHDVPLSTFMDDVNRGNLPAFSMLLPINSHNMHDNSVLSGDEYARSILDPLLNSKAYTKGDVAIFFLWDGDTPTPNILIAPSITTGFKVPTPQGNPISHFSALRTWEEMLGLPLIGDTSKAPSLLPFFGIP